MKEEQRHEAIKALIRTTLRKPIEDYIVLSNALKIALTEYTDITEEEYIKALAEVVDEKSVDMYYQMNEDFEKNKDEVLSVCRKTISDDILMAWQHAMRSKDPVKTIEHDLAIIEHNQIAAKVANAIGDLGLEVEQITPIFDYDGQDD
jgi:hypothetical protein